MKLAVIGTGYVGLVAGACFADTGNNVVCVDTDEGKLLRLRTGILPIYEPGLHPIVMRGIREGRLRFTTNIADAIDESDIIFLAVGTPQREDGHADVSAVLEVAKSIGDNMTSNKIVVIKSTVPIGTSQLVEQTIRERTPLGVQMVSNPEFLKEGTAVDDFTKPERVIIGTDDSSRGARAMMGLLYEPFVRTGNPVLYMDRASAELAKYAANGMLATRISYMNEIAALAEALGADVESVRNGMATDSRIGKHFLFAGIGYGGSCFPKDVRALAQTAREHGRVMTILEAADERNDVQKQLLYAKMRRYYGGSIGSRRVAVWGLAFKPNTDDMREAPSIALIHKLVADGAAVTVYDPAATKQAKELFGDTVTYAESALNAIEGAEALCIVTEWNEFRSVQPSTLAGLMDKPVVFDGRNLYEPSRMRAAGFDYFCIGRP